MNSQFKNSNLGFVIYAALIAIITAATFFMLWYMLLGYKVGTYDADTRLGSVYIGGLREDQVFSRVDEKVDYWYNDDTILFEVKYQGYSYEIDRNVIFFNLDTKTYSIAAGETNELYVSIQLADQETIKEDIMNLPYTQEIKDNIDLQRLIMDILHDASLMKSYSGLNIEEYLVDSSLDETEIVSVPIDLPQGLTFTELNDKVNATFEDGKIVVPEKGLFDVIGTFGETMGDIEMNIMSTSMLKAIHQTNFIVNEVHYNPYIDFGRYTIASYPYYGNNTTINEVIGYGFSFYNPNEVMYYFELEEDGENVYLNLIGLPFEYDIEIEINDVYLDFTEQSTKDVTLLQEGHQGVIIEVVRTITDKYGVSEESLIIYEFYPPIKQINYLID